MKKKLLHIMNAALIMGIAAPQTTLALDWKDVSKAEGYVTAHAKKGWDFVKNTAAQIPHDTIKNGAESALNMIPKAVNAGVESATKALTSDSYLAKACVIIPTAYVSVKLAKALWKRKKLAIKLAALGALGVGAYVMYQDFNTAIK